MADSPGSKPFPWWVTALDAITCVLLALAAWAFVTGDGPRGHIAGIRISLTSELRLSLAAVVFAAVRYRAWRRPTLWDRVKPAVQATLRLGASDPLRRDNGFDRAVPVRFRVWELALVTALMAGLTVLITWLQIVRLDAVPDLGDPLFSLWRLKWIAHQLPRDPLHLFDGNIFYPERNTLAFSDSILLPGLAAAPFLWLGVPAVPVYNIWLLLTFVLAGVSMYALVRTLTGQAPAAVVAGVIFAFYPFRFEHYSHFELQFSFWMPLVLLFLHRTLAYGRRRDGVLTGAALGCQVLSSLYFGIFTGVYVVLVGGAIAIASRNMKTRVRPLLAGVAVAAVLTAPLAVPYLEARSTQGERGYGEMAYYSPTGHQYLVAHQTRTTYYTVLGGPHLPEKELFPGLVAVVLTLVAVWPPLSATRIAFIFGLLFAFEASLGTHGYSFRMLTEHVLPFRGLRVPARASMLVGLSLAILAGYGTARLANLLRYRPFKYALGIALAAIVMYESRATLPFNHVPEPHAIYAWFNGRPTSVIAELPTPGGVVPTPKLVIDGLWMDVRYSYPATFHWQRMLNGNSGYFPPSHIAFCKTMRTFPDTRSISLLRGRGVDYVIVHEEYYGRQQYRDVVEAIAQRAELREVSRATDKNYEARIYRLLK